MTRLVAGKTSAVAFVEIGPDLLAWQALVTRESGLPVPAENRDWKWTDILPSLPAEVGLRYLRMAGVSACGAPRRRRLLLPSC